MLEEISKWIFFYRHVPCLEIAKKKSKEEQEKNENPNKNLTKEEALCVFVPFATASRMNLYEDI